ncbi:MAG: hypothetical protein U0165_11480 [Polyangiaceae bacterium]
MRSRSTLVRATPLIVLYRFSTLATLVALSLALTSCGGKTRSSSGTEHHCECTYLTDFDDTFHIVIDVCISDGGDIQREAATCAAVNAHNHVDQCDCKQPIDKNNAPQVCDPKARDACRPR